MGATGSARFHGSGSLEKAVPNRMARGLREGFFGNQTGTRLGKDHADFTGFFQKMDEVKGLVGGHATRDAEQHPGFLGKGAHESRRLVEGSVLRAADQSFS